MTEAADLTIHLLREIRDGIGQTNTRLDQTVARLDQTVLRLDQSIERQDGTNLRLDRVEGSLVHVEASLVDLAEQQRFVVRHLKALTSRDRRLEKDFDALKIRVDAIEKRIPPLR